MTSSWSEEFRRATQAAFDAYLSGFGFNLEKVDDKMFILKSRFCKLTIVLDRAYVGIDIQPLPGDSDVEYKEYGMAYVLGLLYPDLDFREKWLRFPKEVRGEVNRLFGLLICHFKPILEGDFSLWEEVESRRRSRQQTSKTTVETREERLARQRAEGPGEYLRGNYVTVHTIYNAILDEGEPLTDEEQKMLDKATRWLAGRND